MSPQAQEFRLALNAVRVHGPDARAFLQSQLTLDVESIAPGTLRAAAWCRPDGRVEAVMLVGDGADGLWLMLPSALADAVVDRLRMFSIGRRVEIERVAGGPVPADASSGLALTCDPGRALAMDETAAPPPLPDSWLARDIDCGMPWILPETQAAFLPQMLGLDALDGLSYAKGCFPGQEVIARVHYRGRVTRRTVRFELDGDGPVPTPGSAFDDGGGTVLYAVAGTPPRGLAVVPADTAAGARVTVSGRAARLVGA
jgi:hypothetical protein